MINQSNSILVSHIDKYLEANVFPEEWVLVIENYKEQDLFYHPSSDCLASPKELYQARVNPKKEKINASLRKAFDYGKILHAYYEEILIDMEIVDSANVELVHQQEITTSNGTCIGKGTVDLLDVRVPGHGEWLVDIKTMSGNDIPEHLMSKYIAQLTVYADWFKKDKLMILGVGKASPHLLREYIIQPNAQLVSEIYDRWTMAQYCLDKGTPPL